MPPPKQRRATRRSFLRSALGLASAFILDPRDLLTEKGGNPGSGVLVGDADVELLSKNLASPPYVEIWSRIRSLNLEECHDWLRTGISYRRRIWDIPRLCKILRRASLLAALGDSPDHLELAKAALRALHRFPNWDYFTDGDTATIGLQRAPESVVSVVFALEILSNRIEHDLRTTLKQDLAEKGCEPCYRTLWGIDHPDQATEWGFAADAEVNFTDLDFSRWPIILRNTNLHAVPLSALGVGALFLESSDPRAAIWLNTALAHARSFCQNAFPPDGSYPEGISYWGYAAEYLGLFFTGLEKLKGIDLFDTANFPGQIEFAVALQAGTRPAQENPSDYLLVHEGRIRDIVNFSDSRYSFHRTAAAWIARKSRDPVAQRAAVEFAGTWDEFSPLAYDPTVPLAKEWPEHLLERCFDNGWVVWRSGWSDEDTVVAFRSGGPANHEHADRNSVVVKAFGEWLLHDPLGAAYNRFDEGWLLRQTGAHNALLVDGKGHGYHNGHEGTNASQARARIVRYLNRSGWLALTSDATQAYRLVHPHIKLVARTIVWLKPSDLIVFDKVVSSKPVSLAIRFFPDNTDGAASTTTERQTFALARPKGSLVGRCASDGSLAVKTGELPLSSERPPYTYIQIGLEPARTGRIVSVLHLVPAGQAGPESRISLGTEAIELTWERNGEARSCLILDTGDIPELSLRAVN